MLALDLLVFHRRGQVMRSREALAWSGLWVALAAAFAALVFFWQGRQVALEFVTGYVLDLPLFRGTGAAAASRTFLGNSGRAAPAGLLHFHGRRPDRAFSLDSLRLWSPADL